MKLIYPDIYKKEFSKYAGREHITQQRIPILGNCLWNDVLFFTALNPQELFDERRRAGWGEMRPQKYLKIDPNTLDQTKLGIFLFKFKDDDTRASTDIEDFAPYSYAELKKYAILPQATKDYFRDELNKGVPRIRLFYRYVPHVLYKGAIDITNSEIITIN